ncbi:TetR/AcrR family transcriptional regulator [Rhizobium sp. CG5]|uniref:TetR/AcrR family transcriptional regulator n=1 Tax=Rhizobium sp. CG5 TaxID=2726076 RepID=UPI002033C0BA|nr:TetR/AcrR family transcriptional regulator [Rhizobium sp. CG5]
MEDTRTHILDTGRALTAQRGYTAVGLSELLKTAGVPKGSFYHYFPSKEAFGCALLDAYVAQYRKDLAQTLGAEGRPAAARLLAYFECWRERQMNANAEDKCLVVKLSAEIADLSPDMRGILNDGVARIVERLANTMREGQADGSVNPALDPQRTATTLYQIWLGASLMAKLSGTSDPFDQAIASTQLLLA